MGFEHVEFQIFLLYLENEQIFENRRHRKNGFDVTNIYVILQIMEVVEITCRLKRQLH